MRRQRHRSVPTDPPVHRQGVTPESVQLRSALTPEAFRGIHAVPANADGAR
jgi:hypothetical protein